MRYTATDIGRMAGGRIYGDGSVLVREATNDTRRIAAAGGLFVALRGSRADGHDFVAAAADAGAVAALVETSAVAGLEHLASRITLIAVEQVQEALWQVAAAHRASYGGPVVAITGSIGKTTTKNMLAAILAACLGRGCVTAGNMNNLLGVPLTITRLEDDDSWLVLELGTNRGGEIALLSGLAGADVAIVTAVAPAHLEGFGDLDGVLVEKASLPASLGPDGSAIYPSDCELLAGVSSRWSARISTFGPSPEDLVRVVEATEGLHAQGVLACGAEQAGVVLPTAGAFNLRNAAAAVAAAVILGVPFERAVRALSGYEPEAMRMERREFKGVSFIIDAYNASPGSTRAALTSLAGLEGGRRFAVLGSMLELGEASGRLHREVGSFAALCGVDVVVAVGPFASELAAGVAEAEAGVECLVASGRREAGRFLAGACVEGDLVLLKGSRGAALEGVWDSYLEVR
jgi:UDP-N-acetylmuramoyl-tripeptide--D-alanyl-D-alanine ligase